MARRRHKGLFLGIVCSAGRQYHDSALCKFRLKQSQKQIVCEMIHREGGLESIRRPFIRVSRLYSSVQYKCVDAHSVHAVADDGSKCSNRR
jgi:hypothetical protein